MILLHASDFGQLLATWRRRASDREDTARRFGDNWEGRAMAIDAAAVRQCIAELEAVIGVSG